MVGINLKGLFSSYGLHLIGLILISGAIPFIYLWLNSMPEDTVFLEGEDFNFEKGKWVFMEDVNFYGNRGIMTVVKDSEAVGTFKLKKDGEYTIWIRFFGNYGRTDLSIWKKFYTNSYGYLDYFGSSVPLDMTVRIDDRKWILTQAGPHRYRWIKMDRLKLAGGRHVVGVNKTDDTMGAVTLDSIIITPDPTYRPDRFEVIPRKVSTYMGSLVILTFPVLVWIYLKRGGGEDRAVTVYYVYASIVYCIFSVTWIDTDGGFWIWLAQNRAFTLDLIYSESSEALHHRYVYPPSVAVLLVALRRIFDLFDSMNGITPLSILLSKLIILPFIFFTGYYLYNLEGKTALFLWLFNPLTIFTVAANSMYFGLAFFLILALYFLRKGRQYLSSLFIGLGIAYMSVTILIVPPYLLLLRSMNYRKIFFSILMILIPVFLVFLPYRIIEPAGLDARVMGAGISTWMMMHLGVILDGIGITPMLYGALLAYLWVTKTPLDYTTMLATFAVTSLIYLNVGAPYFMVWITAFQPFIILWAVRNKQELFYAFYVTAFMVWGSFYSNTGGADDRAGETGFFPFYIFYTWPFDIYNLLQGLDLPVDYFLRKDMEIMFHSISTGISVVLTLLIIRELYRTHSLESHG